MRNSFLLIILVFFLQQVHCQPTCYFEHFSTDDGLSQCVVTDIIQDQKGFMWFSTWDGFSKFDGKKFRNYKVKTEDEYQINSSRFEHIFEDKYGYIWLESYDNEAHRFDPGTETFSSIRSIPAYKNHSFQLSKIQVRPSGRVWLVSENNGCICVLDSSFKIQEYSTENKKLYSDKVLDVFEDNKSDSWILTDNGLYLIPSGQTDPIPYFYESEKSESSISFYSFKEFRDDIWFGSGNGFIRKYLKSSGKFSDFKTGFSSNITGFHTVSDDEIIITSSGDGFMLFNLKNGKANYYNSLNTKVLGNNDVKGKFLDSRKQFWFQTTETGIYKFNTQTKEIKHFKIQTEDAAINVFPSGVKIAEDIYGQVWVHPKGGGFSYYNPATDRLEPFYNAESSANWRFSNILHSLFADKQGNLWFCTRSHGLEKITFNNSHFHFQPISDNTHSPIANDVRAVLQDQHERLWIATKDGRVAVFNKNYEYLGDFTLEGKIGKTGTFPGMVYSMMSDNEGNIWLGTKTDGLLKAEKTSNPDYYKISQFRKDPKNIYSISDNVIYSIFQDSRKNIWVGTYGGGLNLIRENTSGGIEFINHKNNLNKYPFSRGYRIRTITENKSGKICIGTTTGLIMFSLQYKSIDDIIFKHFSRVPGKNESLSNNDIHGISITRKGEMFLATFGGGLNKVVTTDKQGFPVSFKSYTMKDGLPADVCLAIIEDQQGKLWISTENNLTRFNPSSEKFKTFSDIKRLISKSNFSEASTCKLINNDLVFGLSGGYLHFSPNKISDNFYKPYIALTNFKLNNQSVTVHVKNSPLVQNIDDTKKLTLKHNQNSFSFEYAALDYIFTDNIIYAYMLEGFDENWNYVQKQQLATYTNIPKGRYTFKVKSTNSDGTWTGNERTIEIEVLPSFWETPWAMLIYLVVLFGLFLLALKIVFSFYRLKKDVDIEKQLSEMKLRFFTDISHEIRTPLTMISGPVDYLIADKQMPESAHFHLNLISQNTNRMLRLVNQILDLRKTQQVKLQLRETDLGNFTEKIFQGFIDLSAKHHLSYEFMNLAEGEKVWVDINSLEIMLTNLISNAFKYTPDHHQIQVIVRKEDLSLIVEIKDTGKGISTENQKKLFTRFASFNEDKTKPSTGIGLSIVKELTNKHGGKISLISEPGKGSTFTLSLLTGLNHFGEEAEIIDEDIVPTQEDDSEIDNPGNQEPQNNKKPTILLVEDDADLRKFIKTTLVEEFHILEAENGTDGVKTAITSNPDLIVSDIMMPETDGIELLRKVKDDLRTSHIPVILLTAKSALENKLEGLNFGADDYITKPFSIALLKARIQNLLEQRKKLHQIYQSQLDSGSYMKFQPRDFTLTNKDEMFMKKTIEIIEENMENTEFTIDEMAHRHNMSRSVFYNKIKSLSGLSPIDFIRDIKLQRAAQLILSGEYMIKEIAYMIGISDVKYFRENFKAKYGVSPSEFRINKESKQD